MSFKRLTRLVLIVSFLGLIALSFSWWGHHGTAYAAQNTDHINARGMGLQSQVTWIPSTSNISKQYAVPQLNSLKSLVVSELLKENIISKTGRPFREVKVKLMQQGDHPYALIFLYSNTMLSFSVARLDFDSNGTGVAQFRHHYRMQSSDFMPANNEKPKCPDSNVDAIFMTPDYTGVTEGTSLESWDNQRVNEIVESIHKNINYPHPVFLLGAQGGNINGISYLPATRDNFLKYMSCPNVKAFFFIGSEDNDPESGRWAGTAFWTADPTDNPVTSKDFQGLVDESEPNSLQTIVLGGCHMFSNNTEDGMCPVITSHFNQLQTYASTVTKIDIPAGFLTYRCYFTSDMSPAAMQVCANKYDPFIKDNQSHQIYVSNNSPFKFTLTFGSATKTLQAGAFAIYDTSDSSIGLLNTIELSSTGEKTCKKTFTTGISQGFYMINYRSDTCKIEDAVNGFPLPERPTNGLGVTLGVWSKKGNSSDKCTPVKTAFQVQFDTGCQDSTYLISYAEQTKYNPITKAAYGAQNNPGLISFKKNSILQGYFYTGLWKGNSSLPNGCEVCSPNEGPIINDLSTTPTQVCIEKSGSPCSCTMGHSQ